MADDDAQYGSLSFAEQIAFFRRKLKNALPTHAWTDLLEMAHDHAFVVAGAHRIDLVADLGDAIDKAIADGTTLEEFRRDFDAIVEKYGWRYKGGRGWRTRVIYETNLRTSYAAGRYAQLKANVDAFPYWQYKHSHLSEEPRDFHITPPPEGLNGLVLAHDDPFWDVYFPPNGWGCLCYVTGISERQLKDGPDQAPPIETDEVTIGTRGPTPRTVTVARGTDPGFSYAPGRDVWLREQATRAIQLSQAQSAVEWERMIAADWRTFGRSRQLPFASLPANIGPELRGVDITQAITNVIGAATSVVDVRGLPVTIVASTLARHIATDANRTIYLPMLKDLLEDPQEVWLQLERHAESGTYRMRTRIIKTYELRGGRYLFAIADEQDGALTGWSFFVSRDVEYVNRQRCGLLWSAGD